MPGAIGARPHPPAQRGGADRGDGPVGTQQQEPDAPARRGGELQPPAGGEVQPVDLAHHPGQSRGAQRFLHGPEQLRRARRGEQDHGRGIEAETRQPRRIEIAFPEGGPEHAPPPLPGLMESCRVCQELCCGLDAFRVSEEGMTSWVREHGPEEAGEALHG